MTYPLVEIGELMARRNGSVDPAKFPDEEFELHSIPAFDAGRPEFLLGRQIGSSKQIIQPNDVMISKIVPHIRRSSVVGPASGKRQIASGEWIVFRSERVFPPYLRHVLISDEFNGKFMATVSGVGGSLLRARPAEVAKIKIPLPALAEQRRIAAVLDKADALRGKRREAITKLDQLLQSVFLDMFGDPVTNPKGWPTSEIGDVILEHRSGANIAPGDFAESGFPVLHKGAVKSFGVVSTSGGRKVFVSQEYASSKARSIIGRDFVVVTLRDLVPSGPTIGLVANVDRSNQEEYLLAQGTYGLKLNKKRVLDDYFVWVSNDKSFRSEIKKICVGSTQIHVRFPLYSRLRLPVPDIGMQRKFEDICGHALQVRGRHLAAWQIHENLWSVLQHSAFSGKL